MFQNYLQKVIDRQDLSAEEAEQAMRLIMSGKVTSTQIAAYLVGLRMKGETVAEVTGSARAMRAYAAPISLRKQEGQPLLDTCGTGGDRTGTFNISTAAAFVVAGAGARVAKHGNRSVSSKTGSADVLAALDVAIDLPPEKVGICIDEIGVGFLFAPVFHPAMKYAIGPRRELSMRTIFNVLGPLTNPAGTTHQLVGVYDTRLTKPLAQVLGKLGLQAAYVVHSAEGADELMLNGENNISSLQDGRVETVTLRATDVGLHAAGIEALRGGDANKNAAIIMDILNGEERGPKREVVLLNAAAALRVLGHDWPTAIEMAKHSIDSGAARHKIEALARFSQQLAASD